MITYSIDADVVHNRLEGSEAGLLHYKITFLEMPDGQEMDKASL